MFRYSPTDFMELATSKNAGKGWKSEAEWRKFDLAFLEINIAYVDKVSSSGIGSEADLDLTEASLEATGYAGNTSEEEFEWIDGSTSGKATDSADKPKQETPPERISAWQKFAEDQTTAHPEPRPQVGGWGSPPKESIPWNSKCQVFPAKRGKWPSADRH
ncbi:hypothetical protein K493DRAFT_317985 [Basidiobolus meristosporus CBS 931.73]|uniref:Uncharacterized protein n=1 Tax=Basidiobolus meristosporus CBS 931.73 TaxID=1314790 RepID=A0A1Y1XXE7_9FUNG|nr:hypothetical protein K493DRAFT_317985 [Basidiobolus meristosporus CBS 931.73]|eukprot:ORX90417.1 hypothetical protein K493DRAFT_317985 [Basidiobolus meristosporus CBS 931.73]